MKTFVTSILFIFVALISSAQEIESPFVAGDDKSSVFQFNTNYPIPKRAAFYSALLPGMGQVYNKQYWKLGVVIAGLATSGYFIQTNGRQYKKYRAAYIARIDNNPNTPIEEEYPFLQTADLNVQQNQSRQFLEYSVVFTTVGYALNVLDAYVAASLRSFDVSDEITFYTKPSFENNQLGVAFVFKLK